MNIKTSNMSMASKLYATIVHHDSKNGSIIKWEFQVPYNY